MLGKSLYSKGFTNWILPNLPDTFVIFCLKSFHCAIWWWSYSICSFFFNVFQSYIVTRIAKELNPLSQFPSVEYQTYSDYFKNKYSKTIYHDDQYLVDVYPVNSKLNCIVPRSVFPHSEIVKQPNYTLIDIFEKRPFCSSVGLLFTTIYVLSTVELPHHPFFLKENKSRSFREVFIELPLLRKEKSQKFERLTLSSFPFLTESMTRSLQRPKLRYVVLGVSLSICYFKIGTHTKFEGTGGITHWKQGVFTKDWGCKRLYNHLSASNLSVNIIHLLD